MSGKTLAGIGIVILLGIFVIGFLRNDSVSNENEQTKESYPSPTEFIPPASKTPNAPLILPSATITIPDTDIEVELVDGKAEFQDGPVRGGVVLGDIYAEWPTDEGIDLYGILYVNMGGSGTFAYLSLFQYFADATVHQSSAFLGDRIFIERIIAREMSLEQYDYEIVVDLLDRKEGEAMATKPTIPATVLFGIKDHKIVEEITQ